jgi:hypothetical protein
VVNAAAAYAECCCAGCGNGRGGMLLWGPSVVKDGGGTAEIGGKGIEGNMPNAKFPHLHTFYAPVFLGWHSPPLSILAL